MWFYYRWWWSGQPLQPTPRQLAFSDVEVVSGPVINCEMKTAATTKTSDQNLQMALNPSYKISNIVISFLVWSNKKYENRNTKLLESFTEKKAPVLTLKKEKENKQKKTPMKINSLCSYKKKTSVLLPFLSNPHTHSSLQLLHQSQEWPHHDVAGTWRRHTPRSQSTTRGCRAQIPRRAETQIHQNVYQHPPSFCSFQEL